MVERPDSSSAASGARLLRILVVDDHQHTRDTTALFLKSKGCEVDKASEGREAVQLYFTQALTSQPYDLIVLDLNMPQGDSGGVAMIDLLEARPKPRIVVCSGDTENRLLQNHRYYGFDGKVTKPFTFDALWREIQRVLDRRD